MNRTTLLATALIMIACAAEPTFAADGKWRCESKELPGQITGIVVANGKVLHVTPRGEKWIPEEVIDLGVEVHWAYVKPVAGRLEFMLDVTAAKLKETVLGTEIDFDCEELG
jgi:hypothetical protein